MSTPKNFAYYYDVIERDSWSGPSQDGYMLFLSQEDGEAFKKQEYKNRTGPTPEYYVNYEGGNYAPIGQDTYANLLQKKKLWVKKQADMLR